MKKLRVQGNSLTHFKTFSGNLLSFKGQTDQHLIHHRENSGRRKS